MNVNNELQSTIGYLGNEFQFKLVKILLEDKQFFNKVHRLVHSRMFTNTYVQHIIGLVLDYLNKFPEAVCSYPEVEILIRDRYNGQDILPHLIETLEGVKDLTITNAEIIKDKSTKFFKQQNLTKALFEAQDIIKAGSSENYEEVESIVRNALELNDDNTLTFRVFDNWEQCLTRDARVTIPTGYELLDEKLGGGIAKGELGVIIAPTGVGKAQPLYSKVLTKYGFKNMGDIKVGTEVFGCDGKLHLVRGVYPQGFRPIYRVGFTDGSSCECDLEHLWQVHLNDCEGIKDIEDIFNGDYYQTMTLKEIIDNGLTCYDEEGKLYYKFNIPFMNKVTSEEMSCLPHIDKKHLLSHEAFVSDLEDKRIIDHNRIDGVRYISSISYIGDFEAQCIMVDSKEHTYITDGFIVTHNTSSTTGFAANASSYKCKANNYNGFKVLQIFFEDSPINIKRKYIGFISNVEASELHNEMFREDIDNAMNTDERVRFINDNIYPLRPQNGVFSPNDLRKLLIRLTAQGFPPDLIILDYFECLGNSGVRQATANQSEWSAEGFKMRELEAICGEFNVAMWVATQGTRDSIGEAIIGLKHNGGSIKKMQIAHIVLALSRTEEQEILGKMNIHIPKIRVGKKTGSIMNCEFNNGTCKFSDGDALGEDPEGMQTNKKPQQSQMTSEVPKGFAMQAF